MAPAKYVGIWLGILFVFIPLGFAAGYIVGGAIGTGLSWRAAFWILSGISVPLAVFFLLAPPLDLSSKRKKVSVRDPSNSAAAAVAVPFVDSANDSTVEMQRLRLDESGVNFASLEEERKNIENEHDGSNGIESSVRSRSRSRSSSFGLGIGSILDALSGVGREVKDLLRHPVGVMAVLGLGMWNAYLGTAAWWGPKVRKNNLPLYIYYFKEQTKGANLKGA